MRDLIVTFFCLIARVAAAGGLPGKDFFYYYPNNTDYEVSPGPGIMFRSWNKTVGATDPIAFGPPTITSIELESGKTYPPDGSSYYITGDQYYVFIRGDGTVQGLGDDSDFLSGDWVWAMAGVQHGPIKNTGDANLTIYAIGAPMDIITDGLASFDNPTVEARVNKTRYCKYGSKSGLGCDYSGPHTADRVTWSGVINGTGYDPCKGDPGHPEGSCLQPHYHPKGALYIGLSGRTLYAQDYEGFDAWIDGGDVRWVRPGRWYGPEYTNDGCEILAMHPSHGGSGDADNLNGSWVSWTKPPPGPYVAQYTLTVSQVYGG